MQNHFFGNFNTRETKAGSKIFSRSQKEYFEIAIRL